VLKILSSSPPYSCRECVHVTHVCQTGIPRSHSIGKVFGAGTDVTNNMPNSEEAIRRGEYAVIRSLIRVLEVK